MGNPETKSAGNHDQVSALTAKWLGAWDGLGPVVVAKFRLLIVTTIYRKPQFQDTTCKGNWSMPQKYQNTVYGEEFQIYH